MSLNSKAACSIEVLGTSTILNGIPESGDYKSEPNISPEKHILYNIAWTNK